jgi:hypothetical protein
MPYPRTVAQIETEIAALAANAAYAGFLSVSDLPHSTVEGRKVKLLKLGTGPVHILIVGGIHAREWAPPDALLEWVAKMLEAKRLASTVADSAFSWPASGLDVDDGAYVGAITFDSTVIIDAPTVNRIFTNCSVFVIPCVNPDGRNFTFAPGNRNWRKNRKVLGVPCGEVGVDINRNFPTAWDYKKYYSAAAASSSSVSVTDNPCPDVNQVYHGTAAASEAETKNVISVLTGNNIRFFLDVHAYLREIYYSWGLNPNQNSDPSKTFLNTTLDASGGVGGRPVGSLGTYGEYIPGSSFQTNYILCANAMHNSIVANAGANLHARARSDYKVKQSFSLYAAPGDSADHVFGTQLVASGSNAIVNAKFPVYAFTIETGEKNGAEGGFQPSPTQYLKIRREIWSAVSALSGFASSWSAAAVSAPAPPGPAPSSSLFDCFIATTVYGNPQHQQVQFLRHFRDVDMRTHAFTSAVMDAAVSIYNVYGPKAAAFCANRKFLSAAIKWMFLEPLIWMMFCVKTICNRISTRLNYGLVLTLALMSALIILLFVVCSKMIHLIN